MFYVGILSERGTIIPESEAFEYAMERCKANEDDRKAFEREFGQEIVEWFYSGNFVKENVEI